MYWGYECCVFIVFCKLGCKHLLNVWVRPYSHWTQKRPQPSAAAHSCRQLHLLLICKDQLFIVHLDSFSDCLWHPSSTLVSASRTQPTTSMLTFVCLISFTLRYKILLIITYTNMIEVITVLFSITPKILPKGSLHGARLRSASQLVWIQPWTPAKMYLTYNRVSKCIERI